MWNHCVGFISNSYWRLLGFLLLLSNGVAQADSANPFPSVNIDGDVIKASGTKMQMGFKYATIGIGGFLVLVGIGVIIHRMREDAKEKEHGNFLLTFIMIALCETVGFGLIAIGWKAFSTTIS